MIFGALVVVLILLSLAFVIIPVLRKPSIDHSVAREQQNITIAKEKKALLEEQLAEAQLSQQEFDAGMKDLETSLALDLERQQTLGSNLESGKWAIWVFVAVIPVLSVFMYYQLGEYRVIEDPSLAMPRSQANSPHGAGGGKAPSMSEMLDKLKAHLRDNPEDFQGWFVMGRTLMSLQQFPEAVTALERALDLNNQDANVMLALADALAMTQDGKITGEPERLVQQALKISPNEMTGLWLAGLAAEQGGRLREAYDYFARLVPMLSNDPQSIAELESRMSALREQKPDLPPAINMAAAAPAVAQITLSISLDSSLASRAQPDDLVFVYAKASSGPPMPLAAKRLKVSDLPLQVTLSDNDAMMPQMKISSFEQVIVGARISKSGNPIAQAGDLFDESEAIQWNGFDGVVEIRIDQVK
ncbi:MAG: c-type cytochrome biogenesis protein CcmI [Gammaproteobacteria bacterium]|nr:c-type cytochrome biogenesis protein CcmI [Gammaproteobacteria bacterium]